MRFFSAVFPLSLLFAVNNVTASVLDTLCKGSVDDSTLLSLSETKGRLGAAVQVGETILSDSQGRLGVLQWNPITISGSKHILQAYLRFSSQEENATMDVELNNTAELCSGSSKKESSFLMTDISSGTAQIRFLVEGTVDVAVWAELLDGNLAFQTFSLQVDQLESQNSSVQTPNGKGSSKISTGEQVHDHFFGTSALTVKERGILSGTLQPRNLHEIESRQLPWTFSMLKKPAHSPTQLSMMNRFFPAPTPAATEAPSPSPAKTFTPTRTMQPTVSFTPTFSTKCDYNLNCPSPLWIDSTASVVIKDYVFPCRAVIQFAELGLVAPDVCEASMMDVQDACNCGIDRTKRAATRTTAPSPTHTTTGPTQVPAIEFFAEECEVCDVVDNSLPLEIDGTTITCGDMKNYGIMGMVPPDLCSAAQQLARDFCKCQGEDNVIKEAISWLEEVVTEATTTTASADDSPSSSSLSSSPVTLLLMTIISLWTLWAN